MTNELYDKNRHLIEMAYDLAKRAGAHIADHGYFLISGHFDISVDREDNLIVKYKDKEVLNTSWESLSFQPGVWTKKLPDLTFSFFGL
jgi:hypothetical protein